MTAEIGNDFAYAVKVVGREGPAAENGYWRIGEYLRAADPCRALYGSLFETSPLRHADLGSHLECRVAAEYVTKSFPGVLLTIVRVVAVEGEP